MTKRKVVRATKPSLLKKLRESAVACGKFNMISEGAFAGILKSSFVKACEFTVYCNRISRKKADEGAFFMASALRGICEDLIALKFLSGLPKEYRNEVVLIDFTLSMQKISSEQQKFFSSIRPFQPVLDIRYSDTAVAEMKQRLNKIGGESGLWKTDKKLPPIEQMAQAVGMKGVYDYFYRVTSDTVHFNPRVAMRNGWGNHPESAHISTRSYSGYYLNLCQTYSVFLLDLFRENLGADIGISPQLDDTIVRLRGLIDQEPRWPEALTYEEMNRPGPSIILRVALMIAHEEKTSLKEVMRDLRPAIEQLDSEQGLLATLK